MPFSPWNWPAAAFSGRALFCVHALGGNTAGGFASNRYSRYFSEQRRRVLAIAPDVEVEETVLGLGSDAAIVLPGSPSGIVSTVMLLGKLLECLDHRLARIVGLPLNGEGAV